MAKMKTFAVPVTITRQEVVYVEARRPDGAIERLKTDEGWREATRYMGGTCGADDCTCDDGIPYTPRDVIMGTPRPVTL